MEQSMHLFASRVFSLLAAMLRPAAALAAGVEVEAKHCADGASDHQTIVKR
jgi:hypothetical protein